MLMRVIFAAVATLCVGFAVVTLQRDTRCTEARRAVIAHTAGEPLVLAQRVRDACDDPGSLIYAAALLADKGRFPQALAITRAMTRDQPEDYVGWVAYARIADLRRPGSGRAALARAHALNPRGTSAP